MITIAITGGIGSGKTEVTNYLISKGFTVVDADRMSREMTSAGGKAIPYIMENFGPSFILEDGSLNRAAMRDLVFKHPDKKKLLEEAESPDFGDGKISEVTPTGNVDQDFEAAMTALRDDNYEAFI